MKKSSWIFLVAGSVIIVLVLLFLFSRSKPTAIIAFDDHRYIKDATRWVNSCIKKNPGKWHVYDESAGEDIENKDWYDSHIFYIHSGGKRFEDVFFKSYIYTPQNRQDDQMFKNWIKKNAPTVDTITEELLIYDFSKSSFFVELKKNFQKKNFKKDWFKRLQRVAIVDFRDFENPMLRSMIENKDICVNIGAGHQRVAVILKDSKKIEARIFPYDLKSKKAAGWLALTFYLTCPMGSYKDINFKF